jgi:hypothetical protein
MNSVERIQSIFLSLATMGPLGNLPFGGIIGSFFGIPLIILFRLIGFLQHDFFCFFLICFMLLSFSIFETALLTLSPYEYHRVVLSNPLGVMIGCAYLPLSIVWILFGIGLYHLVKIGCGILIQHYLQLNLNLLPGILGFVLRDLLAGAGTFILLFLIRMFV